MSGNYVAIMYTKCFYSSEIHSNITKLYCIYFNIYLNKQKLKSQHSLLTNTKQNMWQYIYWHELNEVNEEWNRWNRRGEDVME